MMTQSLVANFEQIANGGPGSGPHPGGGKAPKITDAEMHGLLTRGGYVHQDTYGERAMGRGGKLGAMGSLVAHYHHPKSDRHVEVSADGSWSTKRGPLGDKEHGVGPAAFSMLMQSKKKPPITNQEGDDVYETLTRNYSAPKSRRETLDGREYLVVPMTMIVPGVLNGSKGSLFYPPEEVGKDPTPWNGMPITVYHPVRNGRNVSARDPEVLQSQGIGMVMRSRSGDKLRAEAWIDVAKAATVVHGDAILQNLRAGKPVEISTGLFTDNTEQAGEHNGKKYTHVARNYRPDHLAILPDQRGACSVDDGCGLMMNSNPEGINQYTHTLKVDMAATKADGSGGTVITKGTKVSLKLRAFSKNPKYSAITQEGHIGIVTGKDVYRHDVTGNQEPVDNPMALKSDMAGKMAGRASKIEGRYSAQGAIAREKTAGLVKEHLVAGEPKQAKRAALDYSQTRAKQHAEVAKAHAAAGNHAKAAHFQARADFHKAHVDKLKSAKMTHNTELMPTGEREFVMNQLALNAGNNPHGYNQYTAGKGGKQLAERGKIAEEHTQRALETSKAAKNSREGHSRANSSHQAAADAHRAASIEATSAKTAGASPDYAAGKHHDKMAKMHSRKSVQHEIKSNTATRNQGSSTLMPTGEREFVINQLMSNSNPEGHNQYSGSSHVDHAILDSAVKRAERLSESANRIKLGKSAKYNAHMSAYRAHGEAAGVAKAQGQSDVAEYHKSQSMGHYKTALTHSQGTHGRTHNQKANMLTADERSEIIDALIENSCGCWQAGDEPILGQFNDERLRSIAENNEEVMESLPFLTENQDVVNALPFIKKKAKDDDEDEEDDEESEEPPVKKEKKMTKNEGTGGTPVKLTRDEIWNMLDPSDREAITNAHDIVTKAKAELVTKLTANVKDEATKTRLVTNLGTKSLDELRDLELLAPASVENRVAPFLRPVFGPTGNSFTTDAVSNEEADIMGMVSPRIDWAELAKSNDSRNRTVNAN